MEAEFSFFGAHKNLKSRYYFLFNWSRIYPTEIINNGISDINRKIYPKTQSYVMKY